MTRLEEIAGWLILNVMFNHYNGHEYKDDALDTWACLFSGEGYTWEQTEKEIERILHELYKTAMV